MDFNLPEDPLHPSHDFVTGRVRRLVKVDDTGADVRLQVTVNRRGASRDRGEVTGPNEHYKKVNVGWSNWSFKDKHTLLIVLKQKRPIRCINGRNGRFRLDGVVHLRGLDDCHFVGCR
jgi:hypothetical protein